MVRCSVAIGYSSLFFLVALFLAAAFFAAPLPDARLAAGADFADFPDFPDFAAAFVADLAAPRG
jgi:hypothetical protein